MNRANRLGVGNARLTHARYYGKLCKLCIADTVQAARNKLQDWATFISTLFGHGPKDDLNKLLPCSYARFIKKLLSPFEKNYFDLF